MSLVWLSSEEGKKSPQISNWLLPHRKNGLHQAFNILIVMEKYLKHICITMRDQSKDFVVLILYSVQK